MTYEPSHSTENLPPPEAQAEEAIHWSKVLGVGIGALIAFTIAVWITARFMQTRERMLQPNGPDPVPRQIGEGEIGIVDQVPFDVARAAAQYRRERLERLGSWGWVDRKRGIVHMPVEKAMDAVVAEHAR
jgi:hypothetical protein